MFCFFLWLLGAGGWVGGMGGWVFLLLLKDYLVFLTKNLEEKLVYVLWLAS